MNQPLNVCHVSFLHDRYDVRIFEKQCASLSEYFEKLSVYYICFDASPDCYRSRVNIVSLGSLSAFPRPLRGIVASIKLLPFLILKQFRLIHVHDPELAVLLFPFLRISGAKLVYDAHEDLRLQTNSKPWIPIYFRKLFYLIACLFDWLLSHLSNEIIAATAHIAHRYPSSKTSVVSNYPVLTKLHIKPPDVSHLALNPAQDRYVIYAGGITHARCLNQMIELGRLISDKGVKLLLCGPIYSMDVRDIVNEAVSLGSVVYAGVLSRSDLNYLTTKAIAGLVLFDYHPNHLASLPNKMFEYMALSLPVICSDFPLWRSLIEDSGSGFCTNPFLVSNVAEKIQTLSMNRQLARQLGKNGHEAVKRWYNWQSEAITLFNLYTRLVPEATNYS
jgi:glycosyltransferase involved in cell wall biosynthesis